MDVYYYDEHTQSCVVFECHKMAFTTDSIVATNLITGESKNIPLFLALYAEE